MILWGHWHHAGMPFCGKTRRLERLAAFIDGTLDRSAQRRLSAHLMACESCRRLLVEARALLAAEDASRQV